MKKFLKVLRIITQSALIAAVCFLAYVLIDLKWPGHRTFSDQDQIVWALFGTLFYISAFGLILNSIILFNRGHWRNYRIIAAFVAVVLICLVISPRENYVDVILGEPESTYFRVDRNKNYTTASVSIKFFENGRFLSETFDGNLNDENLGNYILKNDNLTLYFEDAKSDFMGTEYKIVNDTLSCTNCIEEIKLLKK